MTETGRPVLSRRRMLALSAGSALGAGSALVATLPRPSFAQVRIDVTQGNVAPVPIAIPDFVGGTPGDTEVARGMTQVITNNLQRSGLFAPIDPAAYIEKIANIDAVPRFPDWRAINAQALITGRVTRQGDGRLKVEFRLWDVFAGNQLTGQQYFTAPDNWRRIAHIISDSVYERLTGEKGYFDTRIAFIDETGPKERRVKRLAVMDQDGANVKYLTRGEDLVLTPRFSPSSQDVAFMSYGTARSARGAAQHRQRPARDRRQFPRHVVLAALLADRAADHHEPAAGRELEHLRDGPAVEAHDAADRHRRDRHRAVLFARRPAHLL